MGLVEEIDAKLRDAIKSRDSRSADCLRMLKSRLTEKRTSAGFEGELTDEVARDVASTYVKQLKKAIDEFKKAGEAGKEHIEKTQWEVDYLSQFLPQLLDEAATRTIVEEALAASGITDPGQTGRAIGIVMKDHKGKVDPSLVRKIVEEILSKGE
jgi:uncharacterized protein YqeY